MSSNFCPFYVNIKVENPTPLMTHCGTEVLCEFFSKHRKQTVKRVYYIVSCFVLFCFVFFPVEPNQSRQVCCHRQGLCQFRVIGDFEDLLSSAIFGQETLSHCHCHCHKIICFVII